MCIEITSSTAVFGNGIKISMKTHDTPGYELKILHVDSCAAGEYSHEKPSLFQALSQCGCSQCALWVQV